MDQRLGTCTFTATARVYSLVGELRSHKLAGTTKILKKKKKPTKRDFSGDPVVKNPSAKAGDMC